MAASKEGGKGTSTMACWRVSFGNNFRALEKFFNANEEAWATSEQ